MKSRRQGKASLYLTQLDEARCNGDWDQVDELRRKVAKYNGSTRHCLSLTAYTEYELVKHLGQRPLSSNIPTGSVAALVGPLTKAVDEESSQQEDALQGQVCLAWLHRSLHRPDLALARLPEDPVGRWANLPGAVGHPPTWTMVCIFRAVNIRAASLRELGNVTEALETLATALPLVSRFSYHTASLELRKRIECVIVEGCVLSNVVEKSSQPLFAGAPGTPLNFYRGWSNFWRVNKGDVIQALGGPSVCSGVSRREIWRAYYHAVSKVLQQARPVPVYMATEPPSPALAASPMRLPPPPDPMSQFQQRIEIQRVQIAYEALLLTELTFPKATEVSAEINEWVEAVMGNWRTFCSSAWHDEELGEGGREGISRNVLDILYRAATRSFHSSPILRQLFSVHLSLGDFDVAFKALDTYLEIAAKGKSRVEKSGDQEPSLDTDDMILRTASEGIQALCAHGERQHVERAKEIGTLLMKWLDSIESKHTPSVERRSKEDPTLDYIDQQKRSNLTAPLSTIAGAHRAIGIALAHWARISFDSSDQSESRFQLRTDALAHLRQAISPEYFDEDNVESRYALGLLLAEMRETSGALVVIKRALTPQSTEQRTDSVTTLEPSSAMAPVNSNVPDSDRERKLLPLWHLLALTLSARQDFATAIKACEAGLAIMDTAPPIPHASQRDFARSFSNGKLNDANGSFFGRRATSARPASPSVDQMESLGKEALLELQLTQLTLVEIMEGPESALEMSEDLLSLYGRLFGNPQLDRAREIQASADAGPPPKSSAGTLRNSIRSTLLRRPRSKRQSVHQDGSEKPPTLDGAGMGAQSARIIAAQEVRESRAPAIQITDEGSRRSLGSRSEHQRYSFYHGEKQREKLQKRGTSLNRKKSVNSFIGWKRDTVKSSVPDMNHDDFVVNGSAAYAENATQRPTTAGDVTERGDAPSTDTWTKTRNARNSITPSQVGIAVSGDPELSPDATADKAVETAPSLPVEQPVAPDGHELSTGPVSSPSEPSIQYPDRDIRLLPLSVPGYTSLPVPTLHRLDEARLRTGLLVRVWLLIAGLYRRARLFEDAIGAIEEASKLLIGLEEVFRGATAKSGSRFQKLISSSIGGGGSGSVEHLFGDIFAERGYLARAQNCPSLALEHFEAAVSHFPDHPSATVGLCNILLDIAAHQLTLLSSTSSLNSLLASLSLGPLAGTPSTRNSASGKSQIPPRPGPLGLAIKAPPSEEHSHKLNPNHDPATEDSPTSTTGNPPFELDRLAARDRAYVLLKTLTDQGSGWDYSEAWLNLSRALELSGLEEKAKEALWWCVQLEDGRPVRPWICIGAKGYVL